MSAAPERRIHKRAARKVIQRIARKFRPVEKRVDCFVQQNGGVLPWGVHGPLSERKILKDVGHLSLHRLSFTGFVSRSVPKLEIFAHAQEHSIFDDGRATA